MTDPILTTRYNVDPPGALNNNRIRVRLLKYTGTPAQWVGCVHRWYTVGSHHFGQKFKNAFWLYPTTKVQSENSKWNCLHKVILTSHDIIQKVRANRDLRVADFFFSIPHFRVFKNLAPTPQRPCVRQKKRICYQLNGIFSTFSSKLEFLEILAPFRTRCI